MGPDSYLAAVGLFAAPSRRRPGPIVDGTLLQISRNAALFSLTGTTYGGDGRQTFALPDLRAGDAEGQPVPFTGGCRSSICVSGIYPERP
ncbi:phage tail protein [Dankookia rubra]|uniref:Phage tail protein n=1 Tax=Dankookia rubra TaxID=1442381 RepID=A0A4R5QA83_9PROT|nr:tail fiber protein [Dankookia rubra]TDH59676.1 phage tail protein [Dankookia rubra]